ncbi:hypothetical protein [Paludisphaera mucosa]|uniref:Uncharacterized protein n=1 Tax=Paludisphaera mucosa TaxID=3030827 RepID=A0ABT6FFS9_9BACT|nr:hypothetical protein [Paludisphaera mucosa]MDG3006436.1 hypothetical protein [Paludisphaera mucosa]
MALTGKMVRLIRKLIGLHINTPIRQSVQVEELSRADSRLNPLARMVGTPTECRLQRSFCAWSDLLGFGRPFSEADWLPNPQVWRQQAERVGAAYRDQCKFLSGPDGSYMLLLNDGIVRSITCSPRFGVASLASWTRSAVQGHYFVRQREFSQNLPGPRTVLSSGWVAEHSYSEVRVDDLVFDYTHQQSGLSKVAEALGNPVMVSNPSQLQLNTAFSRAYLLDQAGSKSGISGSRFYLDQRFLDDVTDLLKHDDQVCIKIVERNSDILFAVEYLDSALQGVSMDTGDVLTAARWNQILETEKAESAARGHSVFRNGSGYRPWAMGFLLESPAIQVDLPSLKTRVYRVLGFFPSDEDPREFMFEL